MKAETNRFALLLLSSHVWRQDQNGFSHQDPGFLDHIINKKAEVARRIGGAAIITFIAEGKTAHRSAEPIKDMRSAVETVLRWIASDNRKLTKSKRSPIFTPSGIASLTAAKNSPNRF